MAITEEQRIARKKYIGSSDAAAIMGLDPFRSAADVWLEKTGRAAGFAGNDDTERGNLLEEPLLRFAEREIGVPFIRGLMVVHDNGICAANYDGIQPETNGAVPPFVVEAKSSVLADEWGAAGTDEVPNRVIVQVHHQFYVGGPQFRLGYVPLLIPGFQSFDWRLYVIQRDDALADAVAEQGINFMERYVKTDTRPDDFRPSIEVLKRVRREPNKVIPVADELVDAYIAASAAEKQAREDKDAAQAALLAALGDAEGGSYSRGIVTYMETKRKGYVIAETAYRSLRIKKAKREETVTV